MSLGFVVLLPTFFATLSGEPTAQTRAASMKTPEARPPRASGLAGIRTALLLGVVLVVLRVLLRVLLRALPRVLLRALLEAVGAAGACLAAAGCVVPVARLVSSESFPPHPPIASAAPIESTMSARRMDGRIDLRIDG